MAINWKVNEAVQKVYEKDEAAIADIGRRFPLFLNLASQVKDEATLKLLSCLPEIDTVRKIETVLKEGVEEVEEAEEKAPAKKAPAKKAPAKRGRKKVEVEEEDEDFDDDEEEDEEEFDDDDDMDKDVDDEEDFDEEEDEEEPAPKKRTRKAPAKRPAKKAPAKRGTRRKKPVEDDDLAGF